MIFRKIFFLILMILANCDKHKPKLTFEQKVNKSGFAYKHYIENGELHFGIYKYSHLEEKVTLYPKELVILTIEELESGKEVWGLSCNYKIIKTFKYGDRDNFWNCDFYVELQVLKSRTLYKLSLFMPSELPDKGDEYIFYLEEDINPFKTKKESLK